jgi:hypothetical protein
MKPQNVTSHPGGKGYGWMNLKLNRKRMIGHE